MTTTLQWITGYQNWLTEAESLNNAQMVANFFKGTDWTREAIAALCGNMRSESSLNPDMSEFGYDWSENRGYGLVQWTPRSKYWDWAVSLNLEPRSGNSQLARINYEVENNIQWIATYDNFNYLSFTEFRTNSRGLTVDQLTEAFVWGYERPRRDAGEASLPNRKGFANRCLNELDWTGTGGGGGPTTPRKGTSVQSPSYKYATTYKVKPGDTLSSIAKDFHTTVAAIAAKNNIKNVNFIRAHQILFIPTNNVPKAKPKTYTVQKGDTLTGIAKRHKTSVAHLVTKNRIKDKNKIFIGQVIKL